jgi:lysophospholipase L1-like esterase
LLSAILLLLICREIRNRYFFKQNYESKESWRERYHHEDAFSYVPAIDSSSIVFIGDSQTEGFNVNECFPSAKVLNRGLFGNTSLNVLDRIIPIINTKPKKMFIQIGINDLNWGGRSPDDLFITYKKIIDTVRKISPSTILFVQSIFPVAAPGTSSFSKKIIRTNLLLKQYCDVVKIKFINIYDCLLQKDGGIDTSMTYDGLHLNGKGYAVWRNEVKPFVN